MNMLAEHIRDYINPFPNRYTRGQYEIRVLPHEDLDYDGIQKFWRLFKKFPNDFAAAAVSLLPDDVEFIQYDHLNNILFANKLWSWALTPNAFPTSAISSTIGVPIVSKNWW